MSSRPGSKTRENPSRVGCLEDRCVPSVANSATLTPLTQTIALGDAASLALVWNAPEPASERLRDLVWQLGDGGIIDGTTHHGTTGSTS